MRCSIAIMLFMTMAASDPQTGDAPKRGVTRAPFGKTRDNKPVDVYRLVNAPGAEMRVLTYGGIITSLKVPDRAGHFGDIVLGCDTLDGSFKESPYFGA